MSTALAQIDSSRLGEAEIASAVARVREAASPNFDANRMAGALAQAFALWRSRDYARRRDALDAIVHSAGYSVAMLENSIDALLKPFTEDALKSMAARISANGMLDRPKTVGFIAAGNVAGAGIHEIAIALIAGAGVLMLAGKPIGEPIVQYGPFVMNTRAEIERAIADYQAGTLAAA